MTMDCGRVNIKNQEGDMNKTAVETLPWNVQVYKFNKIKFIYFRMCDGSIIAPNVVISGGGCFGFHGEAANKISVRIGEFKVAVGKYDKNISKIGTEFSQIMNVETIYLKDNNIQLGDHIAVIVLENKFSFNNDISPICIDWNNIYNIQTGDLGKVNMLYYIICSFFNYINFNLKKAVWSNFYTVVGGYSLIVHIS
ncbi:uncharacterized protein LOC100573137 [Acyrthosiphon pisum]|uniref:Peptidase S1 domain-containing protein n=1 Tax=Acyrthosiphon pisum TaxID=7029 RepID=A0A8R2FDP5_ACYPI|nr:uncharacterized protein LOC100573137 [Acyrthosiphon pisum]